MKTTILTCLAISVLFGTAAFSAGEKEFMSPDGRYVAYIITVSETGESKVVVETKAGGIICSKSYESEDGEHGCGIEKAMWTPDSKFFIYSMSSPAAINRGTSLPSFVLFFAQLS